MLRKTSRLSDHHRQKSNQELCEMARSVILDIVTYYGVLCSQLCCKLVDAAEGTLMIYLSSGCGGEFQLNQL